MDTIPKKYIAKKGKHKNYMFMGVILILDITILGFKLFKVNAILLSEIIDIIAWVLISKATDIFILSIFR